MQGYFNPFFIPSFSASLLLLFLGIFVYSKNKKSLINILFSLECITSFVWQFCYSMMYYFSYSEQVATFWMKIGYVGVIYISVFYYHFILEFLGRKKERIVAYVSYCIATLFAYLHLTTNLFTDGVIKYFWGYYPRASTVHPIFLVFFIGLICLIIFHTFISFLQRERLFASDDRRKEQIKYLFWAYFLYSPACVDYIANYNVSFYPFGYIFATSFLVIIGYAIVKHQLMNIEVIIKKTLVFAALFTTILGIFAVITILTQEILAGGRFLGLVISTFIIILSVRPIENFLINVTNKYLFQKRYNPTELIRTFSKSVLTELDLDKISRSTINNLVEALSLTSCAILIPDKERNKFVIKESLGVKDSKASYKNDAHMISYLSKVNSVIITDGRKPPSESIINEMKQIDANVCLAIMVHKYLIGILSLGKKKSDQDYTKEDIDTLMLLADALGVAITNALIFEDVRQREKLAAIGTLAAGIKHDIGTPLNQMSAFVQAFLLSREAGDHKKMSIEEVLSDAYDLLTRCQMTFEKISKISTKFADFARPKRKSELEPINISQSIEDASGVLEHEIQARNITVKKDIQKDIRPIMADRDYMQQILFNIIKNAAQAIQKARRSKDQSIITIVAREDAGSNIVIDISDTGVGIPAGDIDKIFEPYYTTRETEGGTGLGLAIVKELVERGDGRISVKSEVGKGTTFTLEFPGVKS